MGLPTPLDAAVVAIAGILGLLGLLLGFARLTVVWPMRRLIPLLGAYAGGRLAEIGVLMVWEVAELTDLVGAPVTWPAFIVAVLAAFVPLLMFMDNLKARVAVWTAQRRIAAGERLLGGLFGAACGLLLVAIAVEHTPLRREMADQPGWVRESTLLPYFRSASEALENALSFAWPYATGLWRWIR